MIKEKKENHMLWLFINFIFLLLLPWIHTRHISDKFWNCTSADTFWFSSASSEQFSFCVPLTTTDTIQSVQRLPVHHAFDFTTFYKFVLFRLPLQLWWKLEDLNRPDLWTNIFCEWFLISSCDLLHIFQHQILMHNLCDNIHKCKVSFLSRYITSVPLYRVFRAVYQITTICCNIFIF